ncbi:MAG: hypothetical protein HKN88_07875 [Gammaproteobacteria bacterium]|nr:hypothetical protein [Gammaproteobacteria bacterium]NNC97977.1 hypothetical protein [Gammaproteobacteria bacterium]NNM14469.1 hypothetical protein [Gammaproteobacteria bacterium]
MDTSDTDNETGPSNVLAFGDAVDLLIEKLPESGHHLFIKLHSLHHPLLGRSDFVEALKNKLVGSKRYLCHILLEEIRPGKRNIEFVKYYQRLTDYIEIRRFKADYADADRRQYVILDNDLVIWQSYEKRHDMRKFTDLHRVEDFTTAFERAWKTSERDLSLTKLYI